MFCIILPENNFAGIPLFTWFIIALVIITVLFLLFRRWKNNSLAELKKQKQTLLSENTELKKQLAEAQNLINKKTSFIANTSHEMRTPLNAIYGFAELLSDRDLSNIERHDYADMVLRNANTLLSIVNDIIDITKIEKGLLNISKEQINLNQFIDSIERQLKKELKFHEKEGIKISPVKYLSDDLANFIADPQRLLQIMTNLTNNALKFTREGFIEFGYKILEDSFILFYVSDSGIGIDREYQKSIFNEFTQIENIKGKLKTGSGLGLTISKNLVEVMGGKMWVESVKGSGSTFYFTIPCEATNRISQKPKEELEEYPEGCWSKHTILIVDDYKDIYYYFTEALVYTGVRFLYAENGVRAIELCQAHDEIELVLMDIQMPEMSGFEATENIRQFRENLPIIAQTAYAQADDIDLFFDAGFNDLITKPIEKNVLMKKMSKYLSRPL